jgi:uncharacterized membrane protein
VFEVLIPVVLLTSGLAAGVLTGTQLGGWPLLESMPPGRYVAAHAFLSTRYDPFMPVCFVVTAVGDGVLAVLAAGAPMATLFGAAAVLALSAVVVSLAKNVPVNKWLRTLDPDDLPDDFAERDPRRHWGGWNWARTALAVLALLVNCVAVGLAL